jgi:uncharacterized protein (TIGR03067 family)
MNLLLCVVLAVGAPGVKDPPKKKDAPTIHGEWTVESIMIGGMALPRQQAGGPETFLLSPDGTMTVRTSAGGVPKNEVGRYTLDEKKSPPEIDLIPDAALKDTTMLGIFKLDGDTLTVCMGEKRPTKFETVAGEVTILLTFKRTPKK